MVTIEEKHYKLLEILTKNCRASINRIAKQVGLSRATVKRRLKWIEKEYGLKYVLDIGKLNLGLNFNVLVKVRLKRDMPEKELKAVLANSYIPQFAAITKGDFDLFIYAAAKDGYDFDSWEVRIRTALDAYIKEWEVLPVLTTRYGFFPLNPKYFTISGLKELDKQILKVLNKNARIGLKEFAKELGISSPLAKYHLNKMMKSRHISIKPILSPNVLPVQLISLRDVSFPRDFEEIDRKTREFLISHIKNICLSARITGSFDVCQIAAFETIEKLNEFETEIKKINKNRLSGYNSAIILKIIFGELSINPAVKEVEWKKTTYWPESKT